MGHKFHSYLCQIGKIASQKGSTLALAVFLMAVCQSFFSKAEGTKQIQPDSTNTCSIEILNPTLSKFASYLATDDERLHIHISNPATEKMYYGFGRIYINNNLDSIGKTAWYRIRDPQGNIVVGPIQVPQSGSGYIAQHSRALAGPMQQVGASGYDALVYQPTMVGDYYIEFNPDNPTTPPPSNVYNKNFALRYFDMTVVNNTSIVLGRLWSKSWDLNASLLTIPIKSKMFVYTTDSMVTSVDLNGMKPFGFNIKCNQTGRINTGNIYNDRKSDTVKQSYTEYKLFLNDPDPIAYPTGIASQLTVAPSVTGCIAQGYKINLSVNKNALADVYFEVNGTPGYQQFTRDVKFDRFIITGYNALPWNGRDGLGAIMVSPQSFNVVVDIITGLTNMPIYDAEQNENGFLIKAIRPGNTNTKTSWDDSNLPGGTVELNGCPTNCHQWGQTSLDVPPFGGFGNQRTMNTWWASYTNQTIFPFVIPAGCPTINLPPIARKDTISLYCANTPIQINYNANNFDPDGTIDTLSGGIIKGSNKGAGAIINPANGQLIYTCGGTTAGKDTILVRVCDNNLPPACTVDTIIITIKPALNVPPKVFKQDTTILCGVPLLIYPNSNNINLPLDTNTVLILNSPSHGSAVKGANGLIKYTCSVNQPSIDTIYVRLCQKGTPVFCAIDTIIVRILIANAPPKPIRIDTILNCGNQLTLPTSAMFTDPDGNLNPGSTVIIKAPKKGTVNLQPNGTINYNCNGGNTGKDTIYVRICDNGQPPLCAIDTIIITLVPPNRPPIAKLTDTTIVCGTTAYINPNANNSDPDGNLNPKSTTIIKYPQRGISGVNPTTGIVYYNCNGYPQGTPDTIIVRVCDKGFPIFCVNDTIIVRFSTINLPPRPRKQDTTIYCGNTAVLRANSYFFDPNNNLDLPTFTNTGKPPKYGTVVLDPIKHSVAYTCNTNTFGPGPRYDTVILKICDTGMPIYCTNDTIVITLYPENRPPIAVPDYVTVQENSVGNIILPNKNNSDPDNNLDPNGISIVRNGNNGSATLGSNGTLIYTPRPNTIGVDTIVLKICDLGQPVYCAFDTVYIRIDGDLNPKVFVPEGFSPNGDGVNDAFVVAGTAGYRIKLTVFNRYLVVLYSEDDYKNNWYGTSDNLLNTGNGKLPDGVYFAVVDVDYPGFRAIKKAIVIKH